MLDNEVSSVSKANSDNNDDVVSKFLVVTKGGKFEFDRVIVATGGISYKATGSDGAGFKIAKSFGHSVEPLVPALCPMKIDDSFVKDLQGVSLKNVELKTLADGKKRNFFGIIYN